MKKSYVILSWCYLHRLYDCRNVIRTGTEGEFRRSRVIVGIEEGDGTDDILRQIDDSQLCLAANSLVDDEKVGNQVRIARKSTFE